MGSRTQRATQFRSRTSAGWPSSRESHTATAWVARTAIVSRLRGPSSACCSPNSADVCLVPLPRLPLNPALPARSKHGQVRRGYPADRGRRTAGRGEFWPPGRAMAGVTGWSHHHGRYLTPPTNAHNPDSSRDRLQQPFSRTFLRAPSCTTRWASIARSLSTCRWRADMLASMIAKQGYSLAATPPAACPGRRRPGRCPPGPLATALSRWRSDTRRHPPAALARAKRRTRRPCRRRDPPVVPCDVAD